MAGGYAYGEHEPTEPCPYCSAICRADYVDIGVGMQQCGPFHCEFCGASEIGAYDEERSLTPQEVDCGWYAPNSAPGTSANVIGGRIVSHVQARLAYADAFTGNPLWHDKAHVEGWWNNQRNSTPTKET